jgi:uncharacterized protein YbjT (DUF2867 family)
LGDRGIGHIQGEDMKVVVIGGSDLVGSRLFSGLQLRGHDVYDASPNTGVNTITGEGLAGILEDAQVVVDVSDSGAFEGKAALEFFRTSGRNLMAAEIAADVRHHVVLSPVGTVCLGDSGYFRAKLEQERLIRESGIPFTIIHSTQFFEAFGRIADAATAGYSVRLASALVQPVAADDVTGMVAEVVVSAPRNGVVEIAGPERASLPDLLRRFLTFLQDGRHVFLDGKARYYGAELQEHSLLPGDQARIGTTDFTAWFARTYPLQFADTRST